MRILVSACVWFVVCCSVALAQANPVPFLNQPLVPDSAAPGGAGFTLTVNGTGFVSGAVVDWNKTPLPTTFLTASQVNATVPAAEIAAAETASITVTNPAPGGGTSNIQFFAVSPVMTPTFSVFTQNTALPCGIVPPIFVDVNGDSKLDMITCLDELGTNFVSILLGNGDGSFQAPIQYSLDIIITGIATGDFNKDGKVDLAVASDDNASPNSTTISILLGNGDGTFATEPATLNVPASIYAGTLSVADVNGDGSLDLVVSATPAALTETDFYVFLGKGNGTFQPYLDSVFPNIIFPNLVAVGDLNGDGKLDLAAAAGEVSPQMSTIAVSLGNGDGTFGSPNLLPIPTSDSFSVGSLSTADINGDGKLDLVAENQTALVFLGNGDGSFQPAASYGSEGASALAVGDFNADGYLDLAVSNVSLNELSIFYGSAGGQFQTPINYPNYPASTGGVTSLAAGDFNGDGKLDIASSLVTSTSTAILLQGLFPIATPSPATLTLAEYSVGATTPPQTVTLTNTGGETLDLTSIAITGAQAGDFAQTNNCPATLSPSANCQIVVTFTPPAQGTQTATLSITDSAIGSSQGVLLTGTTIVPFVTLSASNLTFGEQNIGTNSPSQSVTLTNSGSATLTLSSISVTGANDRDYTQTNNCGVTVAIGASCQINVVFFPFAGTGTRIAAINIADNAAGSPQVIALSGATPPVATFSPISLFWYLQPAGTTSPAQRVTLTNSGGASLILSSIGLTGANAGDYAQTNNCGATIAISASCQINVTFSPTAVGNRNAYITVMDNAAGGAQTVSLSGATTPDLGISPSAINFGGQFVGTSGLPQTVTLTNSGIYPVTISGVSASTADFAVLSTCGNSLAASSTCSIGVFFDPTASGNRTGILTVADNASNGPQTISLAGNGQDFSLTSSSPSASVSSGQTATYTVDMNPVGGFNQTVALTCTGAPSGSVCSLSSNSVTPSSSAPVPVTVTVTAPGNSASLAWPAISLPPGSRLAFLLTFPGWILFGHRHRQRGKRKAWLLGLVWLGLFFLGLTSCGGGNGSGSGTPGGTYNLTVAATYNSPPTTATRTTALTLVVK